MTNKTKIFGFVLLVALAIAIIAGLIPAIDNTVGGIALFLIGAASIAIFTLKQGK